MPDNAWNAVNERLTAIRGLADNWDGQGAVALTAALVDAAEQAAISCRSLGDRPPDRVLAGVNGTVFFEWDSPDEYTEMEFVSLGRTEVRRTKVAPEGAV